MGALDTLTQGSPPPYLNSNTSTQRTLPDWYNSYIQGIAGKATDIASQPYQPYPGQRLADFNQDQTGAFQGVRGNQGSWQPGLAQAGQQLGQTPGFGQGAVGAVQGPAGSWTSPGTAQAYMSPYTSSVVNEIGRLGNQNLFENVLPGVQDNFVSSGQFGSTRQGDMMSHAIRDTQSNISGLQSAALQSGYGTSAGIFGADANRQQQQGALQAQAGLGAGALSNQTAAGQGALGALTSQLGYGDATSLAGIGQQQQNLAQTGYDTGYNEFLNQRNWDWTQLGNVQSAVNGAQLPVGQNQSSSTPAPGAGYGGSPLQWLTAIGGVANAFGGPG